MSDEFIEVPVTRQAKVVRIGVIDGRTMGGLAWYLSRDPGIGDVSTADLQVVVRPPYSGSPFRGGIGRCVARTLHLAAIPAACDGDIVYRVEPA